MLDFNERHRWAPGGGRDASRPATGCCALVKCFVTKVKAVQTEPRESVFRRYASCFAKGKFGSSLLSSKEGYRPIAIRDSHVCATGLRKRRWPHGGRTISVGAGASGYPGARCSERKAETHRREQTVNFRPSPRAVAASDQGYVCDDTYDAVCAETLKTIMAELAAKHARAAKYCQSQSITHTTFSRKRSYHPWSSSAALPSRPQRAPEAARRLHKRADAPSYNYRMWTWAAGGRGALPWSRRRTGPPPSADLNLVRRDIAMKQQKLIILLRRYRPPNRLNPLDEIFSSQYAAWYVPAAITQFQLYLAPLLKLLIEDLTVSSRIQHRSTHP